MMKREKDATKEKISKSAASGAVALIFLILGFQLAIFVMKASPYRYQAYVRRIQADDRKYTGRNDRAANLAQHFASEIEQVLEKYPEQWFNFYEFWNYDTEQ